MGAARLYLVRHGEAAAHWTEDADPGLSALGRDQAKTAAKILRAQPPMRIFSSPMARARETAAPLVKLWNAEAAMAAAITEVPSPLDVLSDRGAWLRKFMAADWRDVDAPQRQWRDDLIAFLVKQREDAVLFTHFVAINAAAGAADGHDRVLDFQPANASITRLEVEDGRLRLIERGVQGKTVVN